MVPLLGGAALGGLPVYHIGIYFSVPEVFLLYVYSIDIP